MSAVKRVLQHADLLAAGAVVLVVVMMIIPLPHAVVDFAITLNISAALAIVVATMYLTRALDFSSFPSLLLLTTLFRLAINVAVTRLILLEGDAGNVVKSFGQFVVGGNVIVGLVIFFVLVIIQFVVVTNGAGRVAEVGARFTLDAMPGKQMAIDADLNAGQITDEEARRRREMDEHRGRGPKGYKRSDERLQEDISARLMLEDPLVVRKLNRSMGRRKMVRVMIGRDTRAEAQQLCRDLTARGGICLVARN